ncbi:MAG: hypothetical protein IID46_11260 [Planctomycetes bacterium]|nr:hypothetical protein [Planctomycetota bacterium]
MLKRSDRPHAVSSHRQGIFHVESLLTNQITDDITRLAELPRRGRHRP